MLEDSSKSKDNLMTLAQKDIIKYVLSSSGKNELHWNLGDSEI